jgi:hypothetical protein
LNKFYNSELRPFSAPWLGTPTSLDTDQEKHLPPLDSALRKNVEAKIIPARDAVERAAQAAIPRPSP